MELNDDARDLLQEAKGRMEAAFKDANDALDAVTTAKERREVACKVYRHKHDGFCRLCRALGVTTESVLGETEGVQKAPPEDPHAVLTPPYYVETPHYGRQRLIMIEFMSNGEPCVAVTTEGETLSGAPKYEEWDLVECACCGAPLFSDAGSVSSVLPDIGHSNGKYWIDPDYYHLEGEIGSLERLQVLPLAPEAIFTGRGEDAPGVDQFICRDMHGCKQRRRLRNRKRELGDYASTASAVN